jgi:hypothetical protein
MAWLGAVHHPRFAAPLPPARRNALPWIVMPGDGILISPWEPRGARGLSDAEKIEIEGVRAMLARLTLPKCVAAWFYPTTGTIAAITPDPTDAWLRAKVATLAAVRL